MRKFASTEMKSFCKLGYAPAVQKSESKLKDEHRAAAERL
jgi:hypothetical protein